MPARVENTRSRGKQTCRCRLRHYRFTSHGNRHYCPEQIKEQGIAMYGVGITVAAICRVLAVKPGTAYEWGKKTGGRRAFGLG